MLDIVPTIEHFERADMAFAMGYYHWFWFAQPHPFPQIIINAVNSEDMMKYVPSIVVRKRHYGDTQDPLATRTNGVGASARSLLFVDGILISSPIGNNNTYASPHFGIAQPEDIR